MNKLKTFKYLALAGLIYSSSLLAPVTEADTELSLSQKPALLALAQTRTLPSPFSQSASQETGPIMLINGSTLMGQMNPLSLQNSALKNAPRINTRASIISTSSGITTRKVIITAYSSTPDQTDSSPFITAMGSQVRDGIVAANFLKFGTKIRIPQVYGDKVFVVEDRMAARNSDKVDIWMGSRLEALQFGVKYLTIEIL